METWSTHHLYQKSIASFPPAVAADIRQYAEGLISKRRPVLFSLDHLANITGVPYRLLRDSVQRKREMANYRMFGVSKRSGGLRFIHAVSSELQRVQTFINSEILQSSEVHAASFAYHRSGGIRRCAARHCGARWMFQFDLEDFFYTINEVDVFKIFQKMGYRDLLSFELGRLCTTTRLPRHKSRYLKRCRISSTGAHAVAAGTNVLPYTRNHGALGVLPQGAPTSPMLSNLAACILDASLEAFAASSNFVYTRYADDLTLSGMDLPCGMSIGDVCREVVRCIRGAGFRENRAKTRIARPGSKKVVLGLLVDGFTPRVSREMYKRIDRHLHAALKYGLEATAVHEDFDSAFGFFNHLEGLVRFTRDVDVDRWQDFSERLQKIELPWLPTP